MKTAIWLASVFFAATAAAQSPNPYEGVWKATWQGASRPLEAAVMIKGLGGSWKTFSTSRSNPCVGREAPIEVTVATSDTLKFTAKFSDVVANCENFDVELKADGSGLRGTRGRLAVEMVRND